MTGSDFVATYAGKGLYAWEAAALELARAGEGLTPWPMVAVTVTDGQDTAVVQVASDVLAVGTLEDHVRLPLTPGTAQSIANLTGMLLPTPLLEYRIWQAALLKLPPTAMVPNKGADLRQYEEHSRLIDAQVPDAGSPSGSRGVEPAIVSGIKKGVVVANFYQPKKVLLFGWYRPSPPAPDVFDDGRPMGVPDRQPIQPKSNVHGDFYVDYSHGIRFIGPVAIVNGQSLSTQELYQHPTLSRLVSHEGPVKIPRYPAAVKPPVYRPVAMASFPAAVDTVEGVRTTPGAIASAIAAITKRGG